MCVCACVPAAPYHWFRAHIGAISQTHAHTRTYTHTRTPHTHAHTHTRSTLNKNSVPGDKSAMVPGGIRIGTPALTTRGFGEAEFEQVAEFIHRAVEIAKDCQVCVCVCVVCVRGCTCVFWCAAGFLGGGRRGAGRAM